MLTSKGEVPKTCILSEDHMMATVVEAKFSDLGPIQVYMKTPFLTSANTFLLSL